ncbi:MAG: diguanylate cyclase [Syntrophobacteraceae bacterium]
MGPTDWLDQIEVIISSCNEHGITTFMNRRGSETFAKAGGYQLIDKSMIDCHPEGSVRNKFVKLMESQKFNCYTIDRNGKKTLVYQTPLFNDGAFVGYNEMILPIPETMPHFVR